MGVLVLDIQAREVYDLPPAMPCRPWKDLSEADRLEVARYRVADWNTERACMEGKCLKHIRPGTAAVVCYGGHGGSLVLVIAQPMKFRL